MLPGESSGLIISEKLRTFFTKVLLRLRGKDRGSLMTMFRYSILLISAVYWHPGSCAASMGLARDCAEHVEERLGAEEIEVVLASD